MPSPKIMVVEDESIVAQDVKNSLEKMDYNVVALVASGEEAIEKAERSRPDAVLMDIRLRDSMDGIEAARRIFSRFNIPVIFLTAYADRDLLERAKKVGSFGYLVKPFEEHELNATIEMALYKIKTEMELRENEERFRMLYDRAADAIFVHDLDGRFLDVNLRACRSLGYTREELLKMTVFDLEVGFDKMELLKTIWKELEQDKLLNLEGIHQGKDGRRFPVEVSLGAMHFKGEPAILASARDITERKLAEEERLRLEAQVQQARKFESLNIMAGSIAHNFNNLLHGVQGNIYLALESLPEWSKASKYIEDAEEATRRAVELSTMMLTYVGQSHMRLQRLNIIEVIDEMKGLLDAGVSPKVTIHTRQAARPAYFNGDAAQVHKVIMNLVTNAVEAMGEEGGAITLTSGYEHLTRASFQPPFLEDDLPEGEYTFFSVADTGCGMDQETISKIFDPFFTTKFTGRGLGLAAVLGIVRAHKGAISISSTPGKSTTVSVYLPVAEAISSAAEISDREKPPWRGGGTVLLVEDQEMVLNISKTMLQRLGFDVLTAVSGEEALKVFKEQPNKVRCVLLDLAMPGMDGEEAFYELRRIREDLPVIFCSGYSEEQMIKRFSHIQPAGFLQKPFKLHSLIDRLQEALGEQEG